MKTKNNVQKTISRTLAVIVSFVLISITVTAQDFWKTVLTNSSFNQIAIAMSETSKKPVAPERAPESKPLNFIYVNDYEEKLEVEGWMTNDNLFNPVVITVAENESELQVEDWMLNEVLFGAAETDNHMQFESWMRNNVAWN